MCAIVMFLLNSLGSNSNVLEKAMDVLMAIPCGEKALDKKVRRNYKLAPVFFLRKLGLCSFHFHIFVAPSTPLNRGY
ncbi:unnamed protein product [Citrullus colocynthis]|uniref:Uncharacterized protein n=1 Tax=Citrullus colocynthis TaxID=252529 RepID=A0ABP0Z2E5_9ROSI